MTGPIDIFNSGYIDSLTVKAGSRYVGGMQGKLIFAIAITAFGQTAALAGDSIRRIACPRGEQQQTVQRQRQAQQQNIQQQPRARSQGCPVYRAIPPVVDPTPTFLL